MVAQYLECQEQCEDGTTPEITPLETEHHTGDGGRYEGQRKQFPYMAGAYDDKEVRRESPRYGTQHGEQWLVAHGSHEDIEAYEQDEDIHDYGR